MWRSTNTLSHYNDNHHDDNLEVVVLSYSPCQRQHYCNYALIGFSLTPVTLISLHILRTNSIAFIMSHTLLSLYYQVKLMRFSGCRITASMAHTIKQIKYYILKINCCFKLTAERSQELCCHLHRFLVLSADDYYLITTNSNLVFSDCSVQDPCS